MSAEVPMSPVLRYTLARLGLFVVAAAVLFALPIGLDWLLRLAIAVLISAAASYLLLRGLRDQVAVQVAGVAERRAQRRSQLHAALAGEDHPGDDHPGDDPDNRPGPAAADRAGDVADRAGDQGRPD